MSLTLKPYPVTIINPNEILWQGTVMSISTENSIGKFDILAEHANFVTIVVGKPIKIRTVDGEEKEYLYESALIAVNDGKVSIYAGI